MNLNIKLSSNGKDIESSVSAYQPSEAVRDLTFQVKQAYEQGDNILNHSFPEFNNKSLLQRMDEDQKAWLSYSMPPLGGEDDWRWTGVRPLTRNRVISVTAHLTSQILIPNIFAQNEFDEEDRDAAYVMRELMEYNIRRSNYETAFLFGVISGLVNPVSYFEPNYCKAYQEVWNDGKKEQTVDDVLSGFQHSLVSADDVLFGNAYQYDLQKQDWIIKRKRISFGEADAKWGQHDNFKYVEKGVQLVAHENGTFYRVDDVNDDLVEEVCYKHRRSDTELYFLNGVYVSNNNTEYNPFIHRTNKNKPKYNLVKYGYEPIDAMRFFGYKSLVSKMANDQEAADREWQMYFDSTFLATFPPTISMGAGKIDKSVVRPGVNSEIGKDAKFEFLSGVNPNFARSALLEAERSINESSQDPQSSGIKEGAQKTKAESVILQQNAQTNLGIAAKMIGVMVKEIGCLLVDDIIRYQSIGELEEITGDMTYKTFILDGKIKEGKDKTTHIKFTDRYSGKAMSKEEKDMENYALMDKAGDNREIYEVNPGVFSRMDFLITIDADKMLQKNDAFERAFKLETYDRAILNPLVQQDPDAMQKITRDFLFEPLMRGEASKYLPNIQKVANSVTPTKTGGGQDLSSRVMRSAAVETV